MKILDCFDHAFVINLPTETQRLAETRKEFSRHNISFEVLNGVEPSDYASAKDNGALGCMQAHLQAVEEAWRRGYESILIVEDDVVLRPHFRDFWRDVLPQMRGLRYDLFYFYNWTHPKPLVRPIQVYPIDTTLCSHFYAVHGSFFERFIALVKAELSSSSPRPVDRIFHAPEVSIVATSYNLAGQRPALSRISFEVRPEICFGYPHPSL